MVRAWGVVGFEGIPQELDVFLFLRAVEREREVLAGCLRIRDLQAG